MKVRAVARRTRGARGDVGQVAELGSELGLRLSRVGMVAFLLVFWG
jgi:hypothetical protein